MAIKYNNDSKRGINCKSNKYRFLVGLVIVGGSTSNSNY